MAGGQGGHAHLLFFRQPAAQKGLQRPAGILSQVPNVMDRDFRHIRSLTDPTT